MLSKGVCVPTKMCLADQGKIAEMNKIGVNDSDYIIQIVHEF